MGTSNKTRALDKKEAELMSETFTGKYELRNRALFILGCKTGFRVNELLRLTIGHVIQNGKPASRITITKTKNKKPRSVAFHPEAQAAVMEWVKQLESLGITKASNPLFISQKDKSQSMSRIQAYRIIKDAAEANGLDGTVGTHSMRKTLGMRAWEVTNGNIYKVAEVLGHTDVNSTRHYLDIDQTEIDDIVLSV